MREIFALALSLLAGLRLDAPQGYSVEEAVKIVNMLAMIEEAKADTDPASPRKASVSESELNSYIAYRIDTQKEEIMKELRLKLFSKNRIEGKALIDLSGLDLPGFLKPRMNLYFSGGIQTQSGKIKVNFDSLFLETQRVQPFIVDWIIKIAAQAGGNEPSSLSDWYELPSGIKDMATEQGRLIVFY
jgi:hypothetical protein